MFERKHAFVDSLALLVSFGPHLVGAFGRCRRRKKVFFPPPLSILEKLKMICHRQWYKATWWMALSYSASQSFTLSFAVILSAFFFSEESHYFHHPPHFSQIRCICPCLAKGKKKPFLRSWIPFPCPHILCIFFSLSFVHGMNYNVTLFYGRTRYSKAQQWLLLLKFRL